MGGLILFLHLLENGCPWGTLLPPPSLWMSLKIRTLHFFGNCVQQMPGLAGCWLIREFWLNLKPRHTAGLGSSSCPACPMMMLSLRGHLTAPETWLQQQHYPAPFHGAASDSTCTVWALALPSGPSALLGPWQGRQSPLYWLGSVICSSWCPCHIPRTDLNLFYYITWNPKRSW